MRQEERRARTIRLLADEAARSIAARGYEATTLEAVAGAVGLSKGAVYAHFPTKLDLLLAVFDEALNEANKRVRWSAQALATGFDPTAAADAYFRGETADLHAGLMAEAWRLAGTEPAMWERVRDHRDTRFALLAAAAVDGGAAPAAASERARLVARLIDAGIIERTLSRGIAAERTA